MNEEDMRSQFERCYGIPFDQGDADTQKAWESAWKACWKSTLKEVDQRLREDWEDANEWVSLQLDD